MIWLLLISPFIILLFAMIYAGVIEPILIAIELFIKNES